MKRNELYPFVHKHKNKIHSLVSFILALCLLVLYACSSKQFTEIDKNKVEPRYLAIGFDDFRPSDFSVIVPLLNQYNAKAEFNIINNTSVSPQTRSKQFNDLIENGHEIGDHTWNHREFPFTDPLFNGQDPAVPEGNQSPYPSNEDMRNDRGDGKNAFGYNLNTTVADCTQYGISSVNTSWKDLSDEECQIIRDSFSVYKNAEGLGELFDWLSNWFLGTSGSSYGSFDEEKGCYTGGIFTGAKTSCNHEVWERIVEITRCYYKDYLDIDYPFRVWSKPGSMFSPCTYEMNGMRFYDREHTIPVNYQAKFHSSMKNDNLETRRSWNDVLRQYEYTSTHDSLYPGRIDGMDVPAMAYQFIFNADLSRKDAVAFPTNRTINYALLGDAYPEGFFNPEEDPGLQMYLDHGVFYEFIEGLRHDTAHGLIHGEVIDSTGSFSESMILNEVLKYCQKTDVSAITKSQAFDICFKNRRNQGNLIYNPSFRNTIQEYLGEDERLPRNPDGYLGDCCLKASDHSVLVVNGETEYIHFGIPIGHAEYYVDARGKGQINIYAIRNDDPYDLNTKELELLTTIPIDSYLFKSHHSSFVVEDCDVDPNDDLYDGMKKKIMGLKIVYSKDIEVKNIRLYSK